ncbi:hypothetical protein MASR2M78_08060 [Treponema sp.]
MSTPSKAQKFWDKIAQYFDWVEKKDEPINKLIIEKTRKRIDSGDLVLDYGCGTGTAVIDLSKNAKIIKGIDISKKMIDAANEKSMASQQNNIAFEQSTIFDDKLQIGSFDVILSFYLLHLLEDTQKEMQRIHELLKPGGLFISATPCISGTYFGFLLNPLNKIGLIPILKSFKQSELIDFMMKENFEIVESECLQKSGQQYFIVAKKKY